MLTGSARQGKLGNGMSKFQYKAFVSYSHKNDKPTARAIRRALHRFAKPWYRQRNMHVFLDESDLSASPKLWTRIARSMSSSEYLVLLSCPASAQSKWVRKEVAYWLEKKPPDKILLALTDGRIVWDGSKSDFEWVKTDALPEELSGVFDEEPAFLDLSWVKNRDLNFVDEPRFAESIADLSSTLTGCPKDELLSEDALQHRVRKRIVTIVVAALVTLCLAAGFSAHRAWRNAQIASSEARRARMAQTDAELSRELAETQRRRAVRREMEARRALSTAALQRARALVEERNYLGARVLANLARQYNIGASSPLAAQGAAETDTESSLDAKINAVLTEVLASNRLSLQWAHVLSMQRIVDFDLFDGARQFAAVASDGEVTHGKVRNDGLEVVHARRDDEGATRVALCPTSDLLLVGRIDGQIALRNRRDWKLVRMVGKPGSPVRALQCIGHGKLAIAGYRNGTIRAWELATGQLEKEVSTGTAPVVALDVSPGESALAVARLWRSTQIRALTTLESIADLGPKSNSALSVRFLADGGHLITAGMDRVPRLWDTSGVLQAEFPQHVERIGALWMNEKEGLLFAGSGDGMISMARTSGRQTLETAIAHADFVSELSPLGVPGQFVTAGHDGVIKAWKVLKPQHRNAVTDSAADLLSVAFSPDGTVIAYAGLHMAVRLLKSGSNEPIAVLDGHQPPVWSAVFSPDGSTLATGDSGGQVWFWDVKGGHSLAVAKGHSGTVHSLAYSPAGDLLLSGGKDGTARLWHRGQLSSPTEVFKSEARVLSVAIDGDFSLYAAGCSDGNVRVFRASDNQLVGDFHAHSGGTYDISFAPGGGVLATGGEDGAIGIWQVPEGRLVHTFLGHKRAVEALAFSNGDAPMLLSGSADRSVKIWDFDTRRPLLSMAMPGDVHAVAFSPEGTAFAAAAGANLVLLPTASLLEDHTPRSALKQAEKQAGLVVADLDLKVARAGDAAQFGSLDSQTHLSSVEFVLDLESGPSGHDRRVSPSAQSVRRTLSANQDRFLECYQSSESGRLGQSGKVNLKVAIHSSGRASALPLIDTFGDSHIANCLVGRIEGTAFPPHTGDKIEFTVPFQFH